MDREERMDDLVALLKENLYSYFCKWCHRHLQLKEGVYVHDDVYHPENIVFDGGEHIVH
jgi:hypothetical protein